MLGTREELSDPFASDSDDAYLFEEDAQKKQTTQEEDHDANQEDQEEDDFQPMVQAGRRKWDDEEEGEDVDDGRSVASASAANPSQPPQEMLMGWSTIGKPGFAYSRVTGDPPKGTLVHPVTVQFDVINTPAFSFDRKAGTPTPLNFITKSLNDKMANLEHLLDGQFEIGFARAHLSQLAADVKAAEPALGTSAKGRVAFIKLRGFIDSVDRLLTKLEGKAATEWDALVGEALMASEKGRGITSGKSKPGHIEASRAYQWYAQKMRTEGKVLDPETQFDISIRGFKM